MDDNTFSLGGGPQPDGNPTTQQNVVVFRPLFTHWDEAKKAEREYLERQNDPLTDVDDAPTTAQERVGLLQELVEAMTSTGEAADAFKTNKNGLKEPSAALAFITSLKDLELEIVAWKLLRTVLDAQSGNYLVPSWGGKNKYFAAKYTSFRARFDYVLNNLRQSKSLTKNLFDTEPTWIKRIAINPEKEQGRKAQNEKVNQKRNQQVEFANRHMSKEKSPQSAGKRPSTENALDSPRPAKRLQAQGPATPGSVASFGTSPAPASSYTSAQASSSSPGSAFPFSPSVDSNLPTMTGNTFGTPYNPQTTSSDWLQSPYAQSGTSLPGNAYATQPLGLAPPPTAATASSSEMAVPSASFQGNGWYGSLNSFQPSALPGPALCHGPSTENVTSSRLGGFAQQPLMPQSLTQDTFGSLGHNRWNANPAVMAPPAVPERPSASTLFPFTPLATPDNTIHSEAQQITTCASNTEQTPQFNFDAQLNALISESNNPEDDPFKLYINDSGHAE